MVTPTTPLRPGATAGDCSDAGDRPFRLPAASVEGVTAAVDGFQGRDGLTRSLVAVSLDSQVLIGGAPVSVGTVL